MDRNQTWSSGNALPIPSASSTGNPVLAPTTNGSNELTPPISAAIKLVILLS